LIDSDLRYHWKFHRHTGHHRPTWSVMRSVSNGRWVGVVEGGSDTAGTTGCGWVGWCRFWSIIT